MKRWIHSMGLVALVLLGTCGNVLAQDELKVDAERSRLSAERAKAEADYKSEGKACYRKFAVNDCLETAKAKRRQIVSDLRRQEIALNDAERKRKAAERLRSVEERNAEQAKRQESQVQGSAAAEKERQARATERAASRDASSAAAPGKAASREEEVRRRQAEKAAAERSRAEEAAKNVQEHQKRLAEAEERRQKQAKRLAERSKKPAAQPLPVPP